MEFQKIDLYKPVIANRVGPPPIVINALVENTTAAAVGGVPSKTQSLERYILLSALPREFQQRIEMFIQTQIAGM